MNTTKIETLEVAGLIPAMKALRLPYNKEPRSKTAIDEENTIYSEKFIALELSKTDYISKEDITLVKKLITSGDEHAKVIRGIIVYAKITAPIYFWWDLETYIVGHQRLSSESTMNAECKGLKGEAAQKAKANILFGRLITKIDYFSYQTLRRIYKQRLHHRLPEFQQFCKWIETLPLAKELILTGLK